MHANRIAERPEQTAAPEGDESLVRRVRAGDPEAFETLFRTYYPKLASLAYAFVKSRQVAEEIVQDALLRVWEQRESIEIRGPVRSYLYAAVRH